ncbi:mitotic fidelity of chromosome transmission- protein [Fusarium equiseti]|uniref:Mitotic fidelity of chromosome transmission-protein n=1 Tax=Fusarium equiseti TaxID=61235 RepID=A0ABQ8RC70_FUSEQ|nr:mitotic fidelity of chromosome transmission- protein [Fusarium equiseti]
MAPRGGPRRSEVAEPQAFHALGVRGRKTGVELVDTGNRDEHGMQPLDDLLSSPDNKESEHTLRHSDDDEGNDQYESGDNDDEEGSEDMEIDTNPGPGPQTVLRRNIIPLPRSRSPVKTTLLSSPRRNPNLEHLSSPTRSPGPKERDNTVTRKIDFGAKPTGRGKATANGVNGTTHEEDDEETEDAPEGDDEVEDNMDLLNESLQLVDGMGGNSSEPGSEPESEAESEPAPAPPPKVTKTSAKSNQERAGADSKKPGRRGRPPKAKPVEEEPVVEEPVEEEPEEPQEIIKPAKGRPGRKPKNAAQPTESKAPASRKRPASEEQEEIEEQEHEASEPEQEQEPPRQTKKPRTEAPKPSKPTKPVPSKTAPTKPEAKPRGRPGRKPKAQAAADAADDVGETSFAALQRGPPLPKKRGLVSVRHDAEEVRTTRSGRHSFKPLSWWAGDKVVQEEEEFKDVSGRDRFVLSTIKEVIRAPVEEVRSKPARSRGRPGKAKSKAVREVETVEPEEWEIDPGVVNGEVILWDPEHERNPPGDEEPVEVMDDRIAISGSAIQTREVQNVSFRMAKTLTTPFLGAGVVDLPAGSEKRPKNSRKMHMVFFVHTGKVLVTVNEASFRLSAGGMWFVPRGTVLVCFNFRSY